MNINRFVQKIVRAGVYPQQPVATVGEGGDHQNREVCRFGILSQSSAYFEPVHLRHHQIEQNDVRRAARNFLQSVHSVFRLIHFVAPRFQLVSQQGAVVFFVIHDQHESVRPRCPCGANGSDIFGFTLHVLMSQELFFVGAILPRQ